MSVVSTLNVYKLDAVLRAGCVQRHVLIRCAKIRTRAA
jgi:hypothetical protein